jgi:hypothetical protein
LEARTAAAPVVATPPPAPSAPVLDSTPTEPVPPPAATAAEAETPPAATTIAGCLTFDAGNYRLKDVTGADAPKSRSWKSGFLRRSSATIDLRDVNYSLGLANYVGKRVEATGTLSDKEMQVRSLERLAESCRK